LFDIVIKNTYFYSMLTIDEILQLQQKVCSENDVNAYGQLYTSFMPKLIQFAKSIIKNKELAEEIVSDVFVKVWEKRAQLCGIENLRLYLYISTKNTALNYLSRHYRKNLVSLDDINIEVSTIQYSPEQILINSEMINRINSAIALLPPRCRLVFKLAKEDGLKYNEIAKLLNISIKTIDNQMSIAIKKIATSINYNLKKVSRN